MLYRVAFGNRLSLPAALSPDYQNLSKLELDILSLLPLLDPGLTSALTRTFALTSR